MGYGVFLAQKVPKTGQKEASQNFPVPAEWLGLRQLKAKQKILQKELSLCSAPKRSGGYCQKRVSLCTMCKKQDVKREILRNSKGYK